MANLTGSSGAQVILFRPLVGQVSLRGPSHPFFPRWNASLGRIAWLPVVFLLCLLTLGCGGGDDKPPPRSAAPPNTAPPAAKPAPEKVAAKPAKQPAEKEEAADELAENVGDSASDADAGANEGATDGDAKKTEKSANKSEKEKPKPEPPKRPVELDKWKTEHYLSAKRDRDRRLEEAIKLMGEKFAGDARAANLFKQLMVVDHLPAEKKPDGTEGKPIDVIPTRQVVDAAVVSLGLNRTPEATQILKDLLLGKLETPLAGRQLVVVVLTEMVKHLDYPENEEYIFGLLTQPDRTLEGVTLNPEAPLTNDKLRAEILGLIGSKSSPQFNMRLAKFLEDPSITKATASDFESMLVRDRPDTLLAKLVLYQNEHAELRTKNAAEAAMLAHSDLALSMLLGLPPRLEEMPPIGAISRPTKRQNGFPDEEIQSEMLFASNCWTPQIQDFLLAQINKKGDLVNSPGPTQLIGTMPTTSARFAMNELVNLQAKNGPRGWTSAGMFGRATTDPAFVIMAKSVYHGPPRRTTDAPDQTKRDAWRDAMDPLIQGWIRRFYSAARNSTPEMWSQAKESGTFRVVPHRDANIVTEFHLVWPGEQQAMIPDVPLAPLEIHYMRIEEENVPDKLAAHYKRFGASGANAPKRTVRNGHWFDDLGSGATPKSKRSVDVIISHKPIVEEKPTPGVVSQPKPIPVVIDILTIEIPDPATK